MVTLDSSGLFELLDRGAQRHAWARAALAAEGPPFVLPAGILGEVTYVVEAKLGLPALDAFLEDVETGAYTIDCGEQDVARVRRLIHRYADLSLGFADAAVVACAERHGGRVLTLDFRDFGPIAREGLVTLVP